MMWTGVLGAHRKEEGEEDSKEAFSELNFHITHRLIIALQTFQGPCYTWVDIYLGITHYTPIFLDY